MPSIYIKKNTAEFVWTRERVVWLFIHAYWKTNRELANDIAVGYTTTRDKLREWGLHKYDIEYWCRAQIDYLRDNYKTVGDVEIMNYFIKNYPKQKGWKRGAIRKKRQQMGWMRTPEQSAAIAAKNTAPGGPSYTILKNSNSINMHPSWIVSITNGANKKLDPELKEQLINDKKYVAEAKALILLKRKLKEKKKEERNPVIIRPAKPVKIKSVKDAPTPNKLVKERPQHVKNVVPKDKTPGKIVREIREEQQSGPLHGSEDWYQARSEACLKAYFSEEDKMDGEEL